MVKNGIEISLPENFIRYGGTMKFERLTQEEIEEIQQFNDKLAMKIRYIENERDELKRKLDAMLDRDKTNLLTI